jgi:hypothetical protein
VAERVTEALRPKTRRRKSGDDTRELFPRARHMMTKRAKPHAAATATLAETLDWLQLWENNADIGSHAASGYNAEQSQFRPQL